MGYPIEGIDADGVSFHVDRPFFPEKPPRDAGPARDPRDTIGQAAEYQIGHRVVDRGNGRYFLLGGFAKWWCAPQTIQISDSDGPAPADDRLLPVAATTLALRVVPPSQPILEIGKLGGRRFLRATLPPPVAAHAASAVKAAKPFFTIVGFHLQTQGGAVGGVFTPQIAAGTPGAIDATVSFAACASFDRGRMNRRVIAGHWVFLLFYDDQVSEPLNVTLAQTDY